MCMRKFYLLALVIATSTAVFGQQSTGSSKKKISLNGRAADHFMIQLSSDHWLGAPDSVKNHIKTLSRGFNAYFMFDKVFKSSPSFSVAGGLGISTSGIFLNKMNADISGTVPVLKFNNLDTSAHFSKYKVATTYAEIPVELRYCSDPENPNKSVKAAIGIKVGTLLSAHTKGKNWSDASDKTINSYTSKLSSKSYFNGTRLSATARVGYGNFTLFGSYSLTSAFKDNVAADIKVLQVGLTISGL